MKLRINLLREPKKSTYSSADVVTGVLSLDIGNCLSVSELKLSIEGSLEANDLEDIGIEDASGLSFFKVLETSKTVFPAPPMRSSTRYTFAPGIYKYSFGIDFTLLLRCMNARLTDLCIPKRFRRATRTLFEIKATAKGVGLLRRRLHSRLYITLVQLEMPNIPPIFYKGRHLKCQAYQVVPYHLLNLSEGPSERGGANEGGYKVLPRYSPAVVLGAIVEGDDGDRDTMTLHPDGHLPLSFWVVLLGNSSGVADVWLRSIQVSLIDPSISAKGGQHLIRPLEIVLYRTIPKLPLHIGDAELHAGAVQVDTSLWEDCVIPRKTTSWSRNKEYLLRVLCELSAGDFSNFVVSFFPMRTSHSAFHPLQSVNKTCAALQFATVVVPVTIGDVLNPPPRYNLSTGPPASL
ncbi:hypothetical protein F4678DRAFT_466106 [Xylaria arbuscula]|nr:hypothetical protein F4678DRAFT_466106 [Xylaria arbuscula]